MFDLLNVNDRKTTVPCDNNSDKELYQRKQLEEEAATLRRTDPNINAVIETHDEFVVHGPLCFLITDDSAQIVGYLAIGPLSSVCLPISQV